jgi:signal transduction histidine kinase
MSGSQALWALRPPPDAAGAVRLGVWEPRSPAQLTTFRQQLSAALHDGSRPRAADEPAVEHLLLAYEEIVSNALRHGRAPVQVQLYRVGRAWLLDVSDGAPDEPPVPAVGRDAAEGGLGLYLVARLSAAHGWTTAPGRKHVWVVVDFDEPVTG